MTSDAEMAAAMHGIAENVVFPPKDRLAAALVALDYYTQRARPDALREAATLADSKGHHWSGAPAQAFFDLGTELRELIEKERP